eukprot:6191329-Pleurochrysis_carterae.AAC.2
MANRAAACLSVLYLLQEDSLHPRSLPVNELARRLRTLYDETQKRVRMRASIRRKHAAIPASARTDSLAKQPENALSFRYRSMPHPRACCRGKRNGRCFLTCFGQSMELHAKRKGEDGFGRLRSKARGGATWCLWNQRGSLNTRGSQKVQTEERARTQRLLSAPGTVREGGTGPPKACGVAPSCSARWG